MARIKGIDLPKNKRGVIALTYIYGIGSSFAKDILKKVNISEDIKVKDWSDDQTSSIRSLINDQYTVEGELRADVGRNIKRLIDIGTYRGLRHKKGLPTRGQNTKNNSRTRKGKKKTIAGKKKVI